LPDAATRRIPSRTEIATRLRAIIVEHLGIGADFAESALLMDGSGLALDELDVMEIMLSIEESFDIDLPYGLESCVTTSTTLGQLIDLVQGAIS